MGPNQLVKMVILQKYTTELLNFKSLTGSVYTFTHMKP